jgi:hypothetical protein
MTLLLTEAVLEVRVETPRDTLSTSFGSELVGIVAAACDTLVERAMIFVWREGDYSVVLSGIRSW